MLLKCKTLLALDKRVDYIISHQHGGVGVERSIPQLRCRQRPGTPRAHLHSSAHA